jgi:hypothetical protein
MITVHHLNNSRSQRVPWLLEELGVAHEVKRYERDAKTMLAPPAPLLLKLVCDRVANGPAPWPISAIARRITGTVQNSFIGPQLGAHTHTSARWNAAAPIRSRTARLRLRIES